ncbi:MAG TPA: putative Fe-S cluster assembly protein SufT [Verrucomicrobiota bacterium]|nr:putative Fe-S cluster assembly protein SufT [Verrucomicrobiota bacterium]
MKPGDSIPLTRDVDAVIVPAGYPVRLLAGEKATLTQDLGGSYTVVVNGNMFRLAGKDADAIGLEVAATVKDAAYSGPVDEKQLWEVMKSCYDPEIPVNLVDLGLIYGCTVTPLPAGGHRVDVKMTLTAPGCGMGSTIAHDVETKVMSVPGVTETHVELVWDPPWNQSMMSEAAKLQLGLL